MRILVPLVNGFEEIEAISVIDILRRAGLEVVTAGLPGTMVTGDWGVKVITDKMLRDIDPDHFEAIVLPGGQGSTTFEKSKKLNEILENFQKEKKLVCAICYSPIILARKGLLKDKRATVYPGKERELPMPRGERVVVDGNIITSQGPGTAMEFALKIVEHVKGKQMSDKLRRGLVFECSCR